MELLIAGKHDDRAPEEYSHGRDADFKLRAGYMHIRGLDLILDDLCHRRDHLLQLPRDRFREEALGVLKRHTTQAILDLFGLARQ